MKNLKINLLAISLVIMMSIIHTSSYAQNQKLPLLAYVDISIVEPIIETLEFDELTEMKEIDQILLENELESLLLEIWSNSEELIVKKVCSWGDDIFDEVIGLNEGKYLLLLKSDEDVIKSYECHNESSMKL